MSKKMMLIILLEVIGVTLFGNGEDYIREYAINCYQCGKKFLCF
jgi:hypothetical protein